MQQQVRRTEKKRTTRAQNILAVAVDCNSRHRILSAPQNCKGRIQKWASLCSIQWKKSRRKFAVNVTKLMEEIQHIYNLLINSDHARPDSARSFNITRNRPAINECITITLRHDPRSVRAFGKKLTRSFFHNAALQKIPSLSIR